jgi:lipoprotein-anchoring transpeptidase ErfK/SrfK
MTAHLTRQGLARAGVAAGAAVLMAASSLAVATAAPGDPGGSTGTTAAAATGTTSPGAAGTTDANVASSDGTEAPPVQSKTGWVALADDPSHQLTIWHNGTVVRTMPISMGRKGDETPNGTYYTMEKHRSMIMSSATYGVPVDSKNGYSTYVEYATRMSWSGIFIHAAPWSVKQQGVSDVSHGCINLSPSNAKYVYDNFPEGTPIVVQGTSGGQYSQGS